ncbi:MAG: crossover junction endodeoxyribonuclease RuvC [Deltaproteobacteria bacterium]|nr:crossover junction endodeoxyribonuclease RuvC [Deltaproteobacteria bacterium]
MTVLLGLDPGLAALGWGIVRAHDDRIQALAFGVLRTERRPGLVIGRDLAVRLGELACGLQAVLDDQHPDEAAIEEFRFYGKAVTSSLQVANVVGMLRETLRSRGIPVAEYSAREIKRAVVGYANATKAQVQKTVAVHLGMREPPRPEHAADALAAAICHAARLPLLRAAGGSP